jgi:16S rRNA (guanine527-N7)-methyltransferase
MDPARIAALLEPFLNEPFLEKQSLGQSQLNHISTYIDLLLHWNARINLTAIRNPEEIVTRHFGESLFLARHLFPNSGCHPERSEGPVSPENSPDGRRVLDIGSGAGFPAIPLKIWAPGIHLTLIESNHKKAAFLSEVARTLTLTNVNVITERAEAVSAQAEVVTLRAVERFEITLPQAVPFLVPNAKLAILIGESQIPYLAALPEVKWQPPIGVPQSHTRVLSIGVLT